MGDEDLALLAAVCANPEDDTPRLVYADWLEDHDLPERAEFIRVQCELARLACEVPGYCSSGMGECWPCLQADELRRRERELLTGRWHEWFAVFSAVPTLCGNLPDPGGFDRSHFRRVTFARGFVDSVTCTAADFLAHADALLWHPGLTDECGTCNGRGKSAYLIGAFGPFPNGCPRCDGGRVPRPCPPTAQPITRVTLTTWPDVSSLRLPGSGGHWHWFDDAPAVSYDLGGLIPSDRTADQSGVIKAVCEKRWPRVAFEVRGVAATPPGDPLPPDPRVFATVQGY